MRAACRVLGRGARVALVAHTHPDFMVMFYACQYAALVPVPLPAAIHLGGHDAYVRHLRQMVLDCKALRCLRAWRIHRAAARGRHRLAIAVTGTLEDFERLPDQGELPEPPRSDELAYLQYTSGSTRFPRGTMITQAGVMHNLAAIFNHGFRLVQEDRFFSWLPYYHDMGLVGIVLGCMATQRSCDFMGSREFAMRPRLWLKLMSQNRATISFSPPFGYALAARRISSKDTESLDLSAWRVAGVGAEMIHEEWLDAFAQALAPAGFSHKAFLPCYGMAEVALAVSFSTVGAGMTIDYVDGDHLSDTGESAAAVPAGAESRRKGSSIAARRCPVSQWKVRDDAGRVLPERHVGRVFLARPQRHAGLLQLSGHHRGGAVQERLAQYWRPGLPCRRTDVPHRSRQGPADHQRPQHLAAGSGEPCRTAAGGAADGCLRVLGVWRRRHGSRGDGRAVP